MSTALGQHSTLHVKKQLNRSSDMRRSTSPYKTDQSVDFKDMRDSIDRMSIPEDAETLNAKRM